MTFLFLDDDCAARAPLGEALARKHGRLADAWAAGWTPSHVRREVREVLDEEGIPAQGLRARGVSAVPLDEIDVVIAFVPDADSLALPAGALRRTWAIPDPSCAPPSERLDAYRAARDEITRRLKLLLAEIDP
jgi:protein-tyrosine-phosphatase